eukprot:TRINITY_DN22719_c0_g1_i1.p1 TRINITY_DN22719_c0_g1~~TRINITY_DN22719_c0_g1_i1.p1  ORF type:complete len:283 (-),score=88.44 TRINITY_DN22719_c0_g1_i1:180-1028(-)
MMSGLLRSLRRVNQASIRSLKTHVLNIGEERSLCYRQIPGAQNPTIVMVPGLHSYTHMSGMKAACIMRFCDNTDHAGIIYDHECMGASANHVPCRKDKVLFSHWVEDAVKVVEELAENKPIVIVGSSMGGWLSIMAAERLAEQVQGLILLSPAINYVYPYYQRHIKVLPKDVQDRIETGDIHMVDGKYGDALLKRDFAEDSLQHHLSLKKDSISISCPVRIIHGLCDEEVNPMQSLDLCHAFQSKDVDLIYRKNSSHEMESPPDLELILTTLDRLIKDYAFH